MVVYCAWPCYWVERVYSVLRIDLVVSWQPGKIPSLAEAREIISYVGLKTREQRGDPGKISKIGNNLHLAY